MLGDMGDFLRNRFVLKNKIEKNEKLMRMYDKTITSLDAGTIKQGKLFMQYEKD